MQTKFRQTLIIVFFIVLIIGIAVLIGTRGMAPQAKETNSDSISSIEQNEATEFVVESTAEMLPTAMPDPAILLESMVREFEEDMFAQSGWLHFVYSYESDLENGIVLPDYSLMPKEYIVDGWYHINEDGKVFEHISTYGDGEGEVYQGSVFTNHSTISWPFFSQHEDEPYTLSLNLGLAQRILDGYERGLALSAEADEMDGRAVVRFLRHHRYDVLNYISDSSQPVQRTNVELVLDQTSGEMFEAKTVSVLEDGTEELSSRVYDFTLEWVELPEEQAQLLADVQNGLFPDPNIFANSPPATREDILDFLAIVNERGAAKYLEPGWVRIDEHKMYLITGETDENGNPVSIAENSDSWYLLGEDGEVLQYVSVSDTDDLLPPEITVYQDKHFKNLTFPEKNSTEPEDFYLTSLDNGLADELQALPNVELELIEEHIGLTTINVTEMYESEITDENGITAAGKFHSYLFDVASGKLQWVQISYIMPDGSLLSKTHIVIGLVEKVVTPPDDVLGYLD